MGRTARILAVHPAFCGGTCDNPCVDATTDAADALCRSIRHRVIILLAEDPELESRAID